MAAKNTTYKFLMEIAGKVDASFGRSVNGANGQLGKLQNGLKKLAKLSAIGFAAKKVMEFGAECAKAAMEFENSMSDVAKVVDGLKDNAGNTTKEYDQMADSIIKMSKKIPMTADEISQIIASAGQAGIAKNELIGFAEAAAKMGIAFDATAEQAGDWMAQWRTALKLNQTEVETLADQINYLGNTSSEKAGKLAEIVSRVGSLGQIAGLTGAEVAALGAATTGVAPEVAATGLKKLMTTMTAGESATDRQQATLEKLGFSATEMAKRMQTDAQGAIMDLLGSINKLPKAEQTSTIKDYFGLESLSTVAVLANNLDNLQDQFKKVGDAALYTGSMQAEYDAKSATTENSIILMKNAFQGLKIQIGNYLLPIIGKAAKIGAKAINGISKGITIASPYIKKFFGIIGKMCAPAIAKLKPLAGAFMTLGRKAAPILRTIGRIALSVAKVFAGAFFQRIKGALTNVFGTISSIIKAITRVLSGICDFVSGVFTGNWKKVWNGIVDIFGGIWDGIVALAKAPLNYVITMINTVIGGLNSLSVKLPGGKKIGINIPTIPMLAQGGIVKSPTLAMIGEGNEPEAVTPLSKLKNMGIGDNSGAKYELNINFYGNTTKQEAKKAAQITFEEFKRLSERYEKEKQRKRFA